MSISKKCKQCGIKYNTTNKIKKFCSSNCCKDYNNIKYQANTEYRKRQALKRYYGITLEDYNKLFKDQKGCCWICGIHQSELSKALCVDHDHTTGKTRSLLCNKCNQALGLFYDNKIIIQKAIEYLEVHKCQM